MRAPAAYVPSATVEPDQVSDPSERILRMLQKASGLRIDGCPWRALYDPFVAAVTHAHAWWKSGQLAVLYPTGVPVAIMRGIEVFEGASRTVEVHDIERERERADAEREAREMSLGSFPPPGVPRVIGRKPKPRR